MKLIRLITAGNVDDGKSTLIGRLLYDSHAISNDVLESIQQDNGEIQLAHLTDGLKAEREQGITIDVAYKYFTTEKSKFIIADCPGHKEYTRNMITGASHADIAVILIDATRGITEQTKRHTFIADLMNIPCIVFCINKMDAVGYEEKTFQNIQQQLSNFVLINPHQIKFIPVSALKGDNVVHGSDNMKWYKGPSLLSVLEELDKPFTDNDLPTWMQVQYVAFQNNERYFFGHTLSGTLQVNEEVIVYPTQQSNFIKDIYVLGSKQTVAHSNQPVAVTLKEEVNLQRGYYLVSKKNNKSEQISLLNSNKEFSAISFWLDDVPFNSGKRYIIQHHSFRTYLKCKSINEVLNLDTLQFEAYDAQKEISMNTIFKAELMAAEALLLANYNVSSYLGSFIIIDEHSHKTVGAGIVC